MSRQRLSFIAASLMMASPLAAQWQECWEFPYIYNAPYLDEDCSNRFYAEIDYLLWYAKQDGLSYATSEDLFTPGTVAPPQPASTSNGKDLFFKNKWDSGVRAAIGFKPKCRTWDTRLVYTNSETKVNPGRVSGNVFGGGRRGFGSGIEGLNIISDFIPESSEFPSFRVTNDTHWKLDFNQLDLEIGREFYLVEGATFRPFIGVRGLWSYQRYNVISTNERLLETFAGLTEDIFTLDAKTHFSSFGAKAGFDLSYAVVDGLELYGNFAGSILWGRFKVTQSLSERIIGDGSFHIDELVSFEEINHSHQTSVLNLDLGLGIRYSCWIRNCQNLLTFKFGWEQHIYTNMNQIQNFILDEALAVSRAQSTFAPPQTVGSTFIFDRNIERGSLFLSGFIFGISLTY